MEHNSLITTCNLDISGTERRGTPGVTLDMLPLLTTAGIRPTRTTTTGTDTTGRLGGHTVRFRLTDFTTGITGTGGTGTSIDMMTRSTLDEVGVCNNDKVLYSHPHQEDPESSTGAETLS